MVPGVSAATNGVAISGAASSIGTGRSSGATGSRDCANGKGRATGLGCLNENMRPSLTGRNKGRWYQISADVFSQQFTRARRGATVLSGEGQRRRAHALARRIILQQPDGGGHHRGGVRAAQRGAG